MAEAWVKPASCNGASTCPEAMVLPNGMVALRNSHYPDVPPVIFSSEEWEALTEAVKLGEYDLSVLARKAAASGG